MYQSIFTAKVSYLPRVDGADDELKTISLGRALIADTWRAQVEAVRAETDPAKQEALKKGPAVLHAFRDLQPHIPHRAEAAQRLYIDRHRLQAGQGDKPRPCGL